MGNAIFLFDECMYNYEVNDDEKIVRIINLKYIDFLVKKYCNNDDIYKWFIFLENTPLYSNYGFDDVNSRFKFVFKCWYKSNSSMLKHIEIHGVTSECKIVLTNTQTLVLDYFLDILHKKDIKINSL
jgi:hypothetical protein